MVRDSFREGPEKQHAPQPEHPLHQPELSQRPAAQPQPEVRHQAGPSTTDTLRQFPSASVDCNSLQFKPSQQSVAEALGIRMPGQRCENKAEGLRPGVDDKTHQPGVEKVMRADGRHEYVVHAGSDARANAAFAQQAVDRAAKENGGTVNLGEGVYKGHLNIAGDNIAVKAQKDKAIFDMSGVDVNRTESAVSVRGKNVVLDGLTIQNWQPANQERPVVGVDVQGGSENVTLQNMHIHHLGSEQASRADARWGAHAVRVSSDDGKGIKDVTVRDSNIHDLKLGQHEAISFMAEHGNISGAKVLNNQLSKLDNIGVVFEGSARGQVQDFTVIGNKIADARSRGNLTYGEPSAGAIQVDTNVVGGKIVGNTVERSDYGVVLESEKGGTVRNIDIRNNTFKDNSQAHVYLDASHKQGLAVDGVHIEGNRYTAGAAFVGRDRPSGIGHVTGFDNQAVTSRTDVSPKADVAPPVRPADVQKAPQPVAKLPSWTTLYQPVPGEGGVHGSTPPDGGKPVYLPAHTLQKFLENPVASGYAAAAGDPNHANGKYGTMFRIAEMNNDRFFHDMTGMSKDAWLNKWGDAYKQKHGMDLTGVHFKVVDTGSAIKGSGRVDLAVDAGTARQPRLEAFNSPNVKHGFTMEVMNHPQGQTAERYARRQAPEQQPEYGYGHGSGHGQGHGHGHGHGRGHGYEHEHRHGHHQQYHGGDGGYRPYQPQPQHGGDTSRPPHRIELYPGRDQPSMPYRPEPHTEGEPGTGMRPLQDWNRFYRSQTRGNNCLPTSMSMMYADWVKGSPANDRELRAIENITHVGAHGPYTGSADNIASQAKTVMPGLHTQSYEAQDRRSAAATLDAHLAQGHTAIVGIKSPYSGNNHYIYVAGKDSHGNYIIGDSGRRGGGILGKTITQSDLLNRMMARHGGSRIVAGWMDKGEGPATQPDTQYARRETQQPAYRRETPEQPQASSDRWRQPERSSDRTNEGFDRTPNRSERREVLINNAVVNLPKDLDPSKPIHYVTYFNGFGSSYIGDYRRGNLQQAMNNAPKNTVFIAARWQDREHGRDPSHREFDRNGGLRGVLNNVMQSVPELGRSGMQSNDTIGLVGFSAGYNAVGNALSDRSLSRRINDIVMLDSPSSAVQKYVLDNADAFARGEKRFVGVAGSWQRGNYQALSHAVQERLHYLGINPQSAMHIGRADDYSSGNKGLVFLYSNDRHLEIPGRQYRRVAF